MSVYSFRNTFLHLNGQRVYSYSADITSEAPTAPYFNREQKYSTTFNATDPIKNTLKITYPLTGYDPIKDFIGNDTGYISGSLGGVLFNRARLKSYSFSIEPNAQIAINAEFNFYGQINTSLSKQSISPPVSLEILDSSNVVIDDGSGLFDFNNSSINSLSYSYSAELSPDIRSQETGVRDMRLLNPSISVSFDNDSRNISLPLSGERIKFNINTRNKNGDTLNSYLVNGAITEKQLSIPTQNTVSSRYNVIQYLIREEPVVVSNTSSAYYFENFVVNGSNLSNVRSIKFNNAYQYSFTTNNDNTITAKVPANATDGQISVISDDGRAITGGYFNVLDSGITVLGFSPNTGTYFNKSLNKINISGTGFFNIDNVYFGAQKSPAFSINTKGTLIQATVPENALYSPIVVSATGRNQFGIPPQFFNPIPTILTYTPADDVLNYNVQDFVVSPSGYVKVIGHNFNGVTGIFFNNIRTSISVKGIDSQSPNIEYIKCRIPSGLTRGPITLMGYNGVRVNSDFSYQPNIYISGVGTSKLDIGNSVSGLAGQGIIYIKMKYKMDEIMSMPSSNQYHVTIGNFLSGTPNKTIFRQLEPASDPDRAYYLTGRFPTSGVDGTVKVWMENGSYAENTGVKAFYTRPPQVYYVDNNIITGNMVSGKNITYLGESLIVIGENLQYITGIQYKTFDGYGDPSMDNKTAPTANGPYPYWSGFSITNDGKRLSLPTTGTLFTTPAYCIDLSYNGISGAFNSSPTSNLSSAVLMSPYGNVDLQTYFTQPYTGANNFVYPYYRNAFYIADYKYSTAATGILSATNAGELIPSMSYLYDSGYLGISNWRLNFSGYTGVARTESTSRNGYCINSGVQVRGEFINSTCFGYGATFIFPARSGFNYYETGIYTQTPSYKSPMSGSAAQLAAGWGIGRTIYFRKGAYSPVIHMYIGISGHVLNTGVNNFLYEVRGDDGWRSSLTGIIWGYS